MKLRRDYQRCSRSEFDKESEEWASHNQCSLKRPTVVTRLRWRCYLIRTEATSCIHEGWSEDGRVPEETKATLNSHLYRLLGRFELQLQYHPKYSWRLQKPKVDYANTRIHSLNQSKLYKTIICIFSDVSVVWCWCLAITRLRYNLMVFRFESVPPCPW